MSESVGVSPIVVMFATFAGGELFGLPGLLLGIPMAALAKVAWRFYRAQPRRTAEAPPDITTEIVVMNVPAPEPDVGATRRETIAEAS
jgi:hypothetical protein